MSFVLLAYHIESICTLLYLLLNFNMLFIYTHQVFSFSSQLLPDFSLCLLSLNSLFSIFGLEVCKHSMTLLGTVESWCLQTGSEWLASTNIQIFLSHRSLPANLLWKEIQQLNISHSLSVKWVGMFPRIFWMSLELIFLSFERLGIEPRKMFKNSLTEGKVRWLQNNTLPPSLYRISVRMVNHTWNYPHRS